MGARAKRALRNVWLRAAALAVAVAISGGQPSWAGLSDTVFSIQASNESGMATFDASFDEGSWDPVTQAYAWMLDSPVDLLDGGALVATLESASLSVELLPSPQIVLDFGVVSGTTDTAYLVDSALVDFNTIPADLAGGRFTAGATVYDSGAGDGMWFYEPSLDGTGVFKSYYNNVGEQDPSLFSHLLALVGSYSGGMASGSQSYPNSGFLPIDADISDIRVHADFILTSNDRAVASSSFVLVPEPVGLTLLALAGVLLARHRRG
ncbi:MAG: hypothetical protein KKI02_04265 [Planctomycetes bacterium]|nr:hypothetical protein [Planctomycetota bacterium]